MRHKYGKFYADWRVAAHRQREARNRLLGIKRQANNPPEGLDSVQTEHQLRLPRYYILRGGKLEVERWLTPVLE